MSGTNRNVPWPLIAIVVASLGLAACGRIGRLRRHIERSDVGALVGRRR